MKILTIFAGYDKDNIIDNSVIYYLNELKKISDIIYISDCNMLENELSKISQYCIHIINGRHGEYDFGSYKRGYFYAKEKNILKDYNYIIFANDSNFGPIYPLDNIFNNIEYKNNVVYGIFKHTEVENFKETYLGLKITPEHLQSHFLIIPKDVFLSIWFENFLLNIKKLPKKQIVLNYELGLSELIKKHNIILRGLYEGNDNFPHDKPFELIKKGYPFLKKITVHIPFNDTVKMLSYIKDKYNIKLFTDFYQREAYRRYFVYDTPYNIYFSILNICGKSILSLESNYYYYFLFLLGIKFSFKRKHKYQLTPSFQKEVNKMYFSLLSIKNYSLFSIEKNSKYLIIQFLGIKLSLRKNNNVIKSQDHFCELNNYKTNIDYISNYIFSIKKEVLELKYNTLEKKKNKKVIYTCITNRYDDLIIFSYINSDWDYVCFTDDEVLINNKIYGNWIIKPLQFNELDDTRNNRWHKMHPHILFPEYEESIYIDSNIDIKSTYLFECIKKIKKDNAKISIPPHYMRNCLYEESNILISNNKDNLNSIIEQMNIYKEEGFPTNYGLSENNCIFRIHNDKEIISLMEDWWYWIENYSKRDQLSLFYVLWKHNYKMPYLTDFTLRLDTDNFYFYTHKNKKFDVNTPREVLIEEAKKIGLI